MVVPPAIAHRPIDRLTKPVSPCSVRSPGTTTKPSRRNLSIESGLTIGFVLKLTLLRTASQIITMIARGLSIDPIAALPDIKPDSCGRARQDFALD